MNHRIIFYFLVSYLTISFSSCKKKDSGTATEDQDQALFEVYNLLNSTNAKFLENAAATNGNPWQALVLTDEWLKTQDAIASTAVFDSTYIFINTRAGMQTWFSFNQLNQDGSNTFRGSGRSSGILVNMTGGGCSHVIQNKKVLIYAARFLPEQKILDYFSNSDVDFDVTLLRYEECKPDLLETFKDYGLVILDTHGLPNGFMSGSSISFQQGSEPADYLAFRDEVISQVGDANYNRLLSGRLFMGYKTDYNPFNINWWIANQSTKHDYDISVTSKYISESPQLSNTVVFGNMCYSGFQNTANGELPDPIGTAFLNRNPISYYSYAFDNLFSMPVSDDFARQMEDSLVRSLVIDKDSTGDAYLKADNTEFNDHYARPRNAGWGELYFKHFKSEMWCYGGCEEGSFTDSRDGKTYRTVCIGGKQWMAENLDWSGTGFCYDQDPNNCDIYGRLYTSSQYMDGASPSDANPSGVRGICPQGWHIPSDAEWRTLELALGMDPSELDWVLNSARGVSANIGTKLKEQTPLWNNQTADPLLNSSGFSALPAGFHRDVTGGISESLSYRAIFASTSRCDSTGAVQTGGAFASVRILRDYNASIAASAIEDFKAVSCRCVKD